MEKILLDTNFLLYILKEKKFSSFEEFLFQNFGSYRIYIFETTLAEIGRISRKALKEAKLLIKNDKIEVLKEKGKIDDLIKKYKNDFIVATCDKELSKNLDRKITKTKKYFHINF